MFTQTKYPVEDLVRHKVYALVEAICNDTKDKSEQVQFEVLADKGDILTGRVTSDPQFSNAHGYKQGNTYEISKAKVGGYTRSLRNLTHIYRKL